MEKTRAAPNQRGWGSRIPLGFVVVIGLLVAWHLYLSVCLSNRVRSLQSAGSDSQEEQSISVNPLTNLVSITIAMPPDLDEDNPFAALGAALGEAMIQAIGPGFIERELNTRARERTSPVSTSIRLGQRSMFVVLRTAPRATLLSYGG